MSLTLLHIPVQQNLVIYEKCIASFHNEEPANSALKRNTNKEFTKTMNN